MKRLISSDIGSYAFDAVAGTITFYGVSVPSLANVLVITDVTAGAMLYNFADPTLGGSLLGNVLSMEHDTSSLSSSDVLQVWLDVPEQSGSLEIELTERDKCCDPLDAIPEAVIPHIFGPQGVNQSFPVSIANEQFYDAFLTNVIPVGARGTGNNGLNPTGGWFDCLQYRSIAFEAVAASGASVTLTFEGSNDCSNVVVVQLFDSAAPATAPVTSVAVATATVRFFEGPLKYRYFRARVSTAAAGSPIPTFTRLSLQPWMGSYTQVSAANLSSNVAQFGGTNIVNAGVAGIPSIGGNIAVGTAPTVNPVTIGGVDSTGRVRRLLTDVAGNQPVTGPDLAVSLNKFPVLTRIEEGNATGYGIHELLYLILQELKTLRMLPEYLNNGLTMDRDAESLISDPKQQ